jgi:hypothetical protein
MSLRDDIARGCLENGECIEARWGSGEWSTQHQQEPDPWDGDPCPKCGNMLHTYAGTFAENCENCGCETLDKNVKV